MSLAGEYRPSGTATHGVSSQSQPSHAAPNGHPPSSSHRRGMPHHTHPSPPLRHCNEQAVPSSASASPPTTENYHAGNAHSTPTALSSSSSNNNNMRIMGQPNAAPHSASMHHRPPLASQQHQLHHRHPPHHAFHMHNRQSPSFPLKHPHAYHHPPHFQSTPMATPGPHAHSALPSATHSYPYKGAAPVDDYDRYDDSRLYPARSAEHAQEGSPRSPSPPPPPPPTTSAVAKTTPSSAPPKMLTSRFTHKAPASRTCYSDNQPLRRPSVDGDDEHQPQANGSVPLRDSHRHNAPPEDRSHHPGYWSAPNKYASMDQGFSTSSGKEDFRTPGGHDLSEASLLLGLRSSSKSGSPETILSAQKPSADHIAVPSAASHTETATSTLDPGPEMVPTPVPHRHHHQDNQPNASCIPTNYPSRLSTAKDKINLNSLHCFIRSELLELFVVQPSTNDSKANPMAGRVGLQCVHCARARQYDPKRENEATMAVFYPRTVSEIYRLVTNWTRCHLRKCRNLPPSVRSEWEQLRGTDKSRGKTQYWAESAQELGLMDCTLTRAGGVRFRTNATTCGSAVTSTCAN